jgi:hypothetical protein
MSSPGDGDILGELITVVPWRQSWTMRLNREDRPIAERLAVGPTVITRKP